MITHAVKGSTIEIETDALRAEIRTEGYVSGVAGGTLYDKKSGARDLGHGLSIVDFLLEPAPAGERPPEGQYDFGGNALSYHGRIPKRYVEGPQICTKARKLPFEIIQGEGFLAVRQWFTWHQGYPPHAGGSRWEQLLVFPEKTRYFFSADRVTTVNTSAALFFRVDMPGHIKHRSGDVFDHIYLSYGDQTIPSTEFTVNFAPDDRFLYQRGKQPMPPRIIRAYQVVLGGKPGPWLAGMTLQPSDVYEGWCHQRGYVCLIEELGGWPTKPGDTLGAAYVVGWFNDLSEMHSTYDSHRGWSGIELEGPAARPARFKGVKQKELTPVRLR